MKTNKNIGSTSTYGQAGKEGEKTSAFGQVKLKKSGGKKPKKASADYKKSPQKESNPFGSVKLRKTNSTLGDSNHKPAAELAPPVYEQSTLKSSENGSKKKKKAGAEPTLVKGLRDVLGPEKSSDKFLKKTNEMLSTILAMNDEGVARRRLSVSDNDVVNSLKDPNHTEIAIKSDPRFDHIKPSIVVGFAEDLQLNFNLKSLTIRSVSLGNEFLSALTDGIRRNYVLRELDLSHNSFTSDALIEFCFGLAENKSLVKVDLSSQHSPIFSQREDMAIDALSKNKTCHSLEIEFQSKSCQGKVNEILSRNKANPKSITNLKKKVTSLLEEELETATKRQLKRKQVKPALQVDDQDMAYLFELYERANRLKLPYETASTSASSSAGVFGASGQKSSLAKLASGLLSPDGSFLTPEFIAKHLVEGKEDKSLTFEFNNQSKMFKRFTPTDPARPLIVRLFVEAIVKHSRAPHITHLNFANALIGDDFVESLCSACIASPELLPNLHLINLESNLVSDKGVLALAQTLRCPRTWKYLQAIKLENLSRPLSSEVEGKLSDSLGQNKSLIKLSLRVRNIYERQEISGFVSRNVDFLRQARVWHGKKTGTTKQRARNRIELLFDSVAANDPKVKEVELVADRVFISLNPTERLKAARSFASNNIVTKVKLNGLELDDAFGIEMGKSLEQNSTLQYVDLEQNKIGSDGQIAVLKSLATNRSILELKLRHQSKPMSSSCEESIPGILADNSVVVKLGIDVRSTMARNSTDKKLRENQTLRRKMLTAKK